MGDFIRIPPDSTGKMIRHREITDIYYSNPTVLVDNLKYNDLLVGSISGISGRYSSINLVSMKFFLFDSSGAFQPGENILYLGNIVAQFNSQEDLYVQANHLVDYENPSYVLKIDKKGSMYTRSREGEQLFDGVGYSQVSQTHRIDDYVFTYSGHTDKFFTATANGGSVEHSTIQSTNKLMVSDVAGSSSSKTSYLSYPYVPGNGTFMSISLSCGDIGKDGVVRRWGLYDDEDGVYFELDGTSFSVNVRSSVSGSIQVSSVLEQDFLEQLSYPINFDKYNLYWLDYQWQGVGRVRFGLFNPDGSRQILHVIEHANTNSLPYMRRGTLPFRAEIFNKYTTSSGSELRITCIEVARQGATDAIGNVATNGTNRSFTSEVLQVGTSVLPFLSVMPKQYFNGVTNRTIVLATSFEVSTTEPLRMDIFLDGVLVGATFSYPIVDSSLFLDNVATSISGGRIDNTVLFQKGVTLRRDFEDPLRNALVLFPNLYQPTLTFGLTSLSGVTASVTAIIRWKEVY
jgi:hypothetical protein